MRPNQNEMTAQECADWLAENDGWTWRPWAGEEVYRLWTHPNGDEELEYRGIERLDDEHGPYKLTLDGAAAALRDPWKLSTFHRHPSGYTKVMLWNVASDATQIEWDSIRMIHQDGPDELTARYRAAVASRIAPA